MNILYPRAKPYFSDKDVDDILKGIGEALHSGNLVQGEKVEEFETQLKEYFGVDFL